jgi:hypothetical protein
MKKRREDSKNTPGGRVGWLEPEQRPNKWITLSKCLNGDYLGQQCPPVNFWIPWIGSAVNFNHLSIQ